MFTQLLYVYTEEQLICPYHVYPTLIRVYRGAADLSVSCLPNSYTCIQRSSWCVRIMFTQLLYVYTEEQLICPYHVYPTLIRVYRGVADLSVSCLPNSYTCIQRSSWFVRIMFTQLLYMYTEEQLICPYHVYPTLIHVYRGALGSLAIIFLNNVMST